MASANQIAGKWSGCPSGRQIHSVAVPAELFLLKKKAPASSTTSRIIMSESSDYMELSPTKFDQVSACEKLRDTVTGISALHLSIHGMDGRSPSPRNSFMDMYVSGKQTMIRRKEEMVSELKTLPPCTISDCQDHKIPSTSVEEENNFVPSPPVNENKIENKIKINSKSKKNLAKNINRKVRILRKSLSFPKRRPDRSLLPLPRTP
ncbi:hypothetical protein TNCV_5004041 [Trichonephila clavipes]|nr:hypothetical protein TNCV_5004041 [Trichonephila clavipes]